MISELQAIWDGFDFTYIFEIFTGVTAALFCICLHELSHGLVAYKLGDDTARQRGRLTLNPIKHLDLMGLFMMLVFHVGWAKPVPVNPNYFKNPKRGMALVALAGPVMNLFICVLGLLLYGMLLYPLSGSAVGEYVLDFLILMSSMSVGLAVFNLLPLPPLDGSKVLFSFIPDEWYYKLMHYERYGSIIIFILFATGAVNRPVSAAVDAVFSMLVYFAQLGFDIVMKLFVL